MTHKQALVGYIKQAKSDAEALKRDARWNDFNYNLAGTAIVNLELALKLIDEKLSLDYFTHDGK